MLVAGGGGREEGRETNREREREGEREREREREFLLHLLITVACAPLERSFLYFVQTGVRRKSQTGNGVL